MSQHLIYTIGPSGAGKDSLLTWLRQQLSKEALVYFARRTIDRPVHAGGEHHESTTTAEFRVLSDHNAFAMQWSANDLHYGIRHIELEALKDNCWVFVNGSRAHLPTVLEQYPDMTVLHITAATDVLRQRLIFRGRELPDMVEARVKRAAGFEVPAHCRLVEIHNNESLHTTGQQLLRALNGLQKWRQSIGYHQAGTDSESQM